MKIVVGIDSFKGSLSSLEAGEAVKEGILSAIPTANVIIKPIADGGEGTVSALVDGLSGTYQNITVCGPLGKPVTASYGLIHDGQRAIIEVAAACGLPYVDEATKNPLYTTSLGVGELILDAIKQGCHDFIIGLGGSATNDGGIGMLSALGVKFFDKDDHPIQPYGYSLGEIQRISVDGLREEIHHCRFQIASDVTNPLLGPLGATHTFGPQKGATKTIATTLEKGMESYAKLATKVLGKDCTLIPGAGAAGGLGYAFSAFLNAKIESGVSTILDLIHLEQDIRDADLVITGEGKLDKQTAMGKAPIGIATLAKKYHVPVIAFAGCVDEDATLLNQQGIDAFFSIMQKPLTYEEAMDKKTSIENLTSTAKQVFLLLEVFLKK